MRHKEGLDEMAQVNLSTEEVVRGLRKMSDEFSGKVSEIERLLREIGYAADGTRVAAAQSKCGTESVDPMDDGTFVPEVDMDIDPAANLAPLAKTRGRKPGSKNKIQKVTPIKIKGAVPWERIDKSIVRACLVRPVASSEIYHSVNASVPESTPAQIKLACARLVRLGAIVMTGDRRGARYSAAQ